MTQDEINASLRDAFLKWDKVIANRADLPSEADVPNFCGARSRAKRRTWLDVLRLQQRAPRDGASCYVIKCTKTGVAKIGHSVNPCERLRQLQTGHPWALDIHTTMRGGSHVEFVLHEHFASSRLLGEWFEMSDDDFAFVGTLPGVANLRVAAAETCRGPDWSTQGPARRRRGPPPVAHGTVAEMRARAHENMARRIAEKNG